MLLFLGLEVNIHAMENLSPKPAVELDIFLGGDRKYVVKNAKETEYQLIKYKWKNQKDNLPQHTEQLVSKLPWLLASSQLKDLKEDNILKIILGNQCYMLTAKQKAFENNKDQNTFEEIFKKLNSGTDCYKIDLDAGIHGLNNIDKIDYNIDKIEYIKVSNRELEKINYGKITNPQYISSTGYYVMFGILVLGGLAWYYNPRSIIDTLKNFTGAAFSCFKSFGNWYSKGTNALNHTIAQNKQ